MKATMENTFMVFADFLQTVKIFPTNFMSAILSANIYAKVIFVLVKSTTVKVFPTNL